MPKEYVECVKAAVKSGKPLKDAKAMCAATYYKRHGMTVNQAHAKGIESTEFEFEGEGPLLEVSLQDYALEEVHKQEDGSMRFIGTALVDNAKSANRRFYSAQANDATLAATRAFMEGGGIVTIYSRHGKAIPPPGGLHSTGLPIGKIPKLFRDGERIRYNGEIYPTTEGKDVMTLVERGAMRQTSIRALKLRSRLSTDETGSVVENVLEAVIAGIDLCDEAGIAGAGIDEILEEAPSLTDINIEEVADMDLKELTLEQLKQERPDLLAEHAASVAEALKGQPGQPAPAPEVVTALEEKVATLLEEHNQTKAEKVALEAEKASLAFKLAIQMAAQIGAGKAIAEALTAKVTKTEDIEAALPGVRESVLSGYVASLTPGGGVPEGQQRFETEDQTSIRKKREAEKDQLTEEQSAMVEFAGGVAVE